MSLMTNGSMASALPAQMARTAAPIRLRRKEGKAKRSEYNFIGYSMAKSLDYINATMRGQAPDRAASPRIQAHFQTRYRLHRTTAPARCLQQLQQPGDVVKQGQHDQGRQQSDAEAARHLRETLRHGTPRQNFQRIIQQMAPI